MAHKQAGVDLESLYSDLGKACKAASYSRVVAICDKILKPFPTDAYALHCKIVSLIRQDRFDDCLEFFRKQQPLNYSPALFETAFNAACYYIGKKDYMRALKYLDEAEKLCTKTFEDDTDVTEEQINEEVAPIRAQKGFVLQQQQKADVAFEVYHTILRQRSGDPSLMVVISNNLICINKEQNAFDTRKRIKASSIDDLQHKLFQAQRSSILVNQALFYLNNNQLDACNAKLKAVLNEDPNNVRAVMLSAVSLAKSKQSSAGVRLLENFAKSSAFDEVDKQSRLAVIFLLVHLQLMAASGTSLGATPTAPLRVGKLTAEVADALSEQILAKLLPKEIALLPLIASLRVALLLGTGTGGADCVDEATVKRTKEIVFETLEVWSKKSSDKIDSDRLLSRCIDFFRFHGFAEDAAHLLEQRLDALKQMSAGSEGVKKQQQQSLLALLIQAYSKFDHAKASQASRHLEFKEKLSEKEVDSLESIFLFNMKSIKKSGRVVTAPTPKSGGKAGDTEGAVAVTPKKHKKKKRPPRLPKNYEPGVPPDPERWLPRRERTGYRGKRRDKRQPLHLQRGPQGVTSSTAPELDMGNTGASVASTPPSAGSGSAGTGPGPSANNAQRRPQQNKPHKSKKGKRR
uniref:Signal recognition particle subunit SRP72 n=1 Tax=Echinococcus granulosus TaxID=6210 RepID=A0A068WQK3_ECHGR|nr:signal recognition particle 72 kDa protein [Echinococcus granulosus]